jgi:hypothetical protein
MLAFEITQRADIAAAADQELRAGDEHRRREGDGLAPLRGVRRRAAFEIDRPRGHELEAVLGRHGPVFDGEILADLARDLVDDDLVDVERISDRLLFASRNVNGGEFAYPRRTTRVSSISLERAEE